MAMGRAEEVSAAWSGEQEEEEEEEEESLGCPRKLKSSGSLLARSPMPGRAMQGWVSPGSDAAPCAGPSFQGRQLQCWVVAVGSPQVPWRAQAPLLQGQTDSVRERSLLEPESWGPTAALP